MAGTTMSQSMVNCESGTGQQFMIYLLHLHSIEQQATVLARANSERLPAPQKLHAFLLGVFVLEVEGRHVVLAAAIEKIDGLRAQAARGVGRVDGGVAGAHHNNGSVHLADVAGLVRGDKFERVHHAFVVLAGNAEPLHRAQAEAEEDDSRTRLRALPAHAAIRCSRRSETRRPCGESSPLRAGCRRRAACTRPRRRCSGRPATRGAR